MGAWDRLPSVVEKKPIHPLWFDFSNRPRRAQQQNNNLELP